MGRLAVEDCLCFDAVLLRSTGVFTSRFGTEYMYQWSRAASSACGVNYTVVEMPAVAMGLRLNYVVTDARSMTKHPVQYLVEVTSTGCRFGGRRFWLTCPLLQNGVRCSRKALRLYLPPGGQLFGCKRCYRLTYRCCQNHDKRVNDLARDPFAIEMALKSGSPKQVSLGMRAFTKLVWWMNRYGRVPQRRRRYSPAAQAPNGDDRVVWRSPRHLQGAKTAPRGHSGEC